MAIIFEKLETQFYPTEVGFRPKTPMWPQRMGFVFINGGGGDYMTWVQPIRWLMQRATWIHGIWFVPNYFVEIAEYFRAGNPNWKIMTYDDMKQIPVTDQTPLRGPIMLQQESLNATGAHLSQCGWVYFTNKGNAPEGTDDAGLEWKHYAQFRQEDLDRIELPEAARALEPGKYAVITTGVTTPSRHIRPDQWNHVIEYIRECGLTPVFLGKRVTDTGNVRNIHTQYGADLRFDLGVSLLDQTSLLQAASIISRSRFIVGHDNGLLHLAGMTRAPICFGYNLASPEHRRPSRPAGPIYDVTLTREELACTHCQSNTNFVISYNFRSCFYGDLACMHMLFENKAMRWKTAIDRALSENGLTEQSPSASGPVSK